MKNEEEIRLLAEWLVDEALATSSDIRGNTARSMGFIPSDLSKIQVAYNVQYGTDEVKLFYQKKTETKGRTFEVKVITDEILEFIFSYQNYLRQQRKNTSNGFADMLRNREAIEVEVKKPKHTEAEIEFLMKDLYE